MTIEGNVRQGPVVAFGELLWDLLPSGKVLGGAPANFAYRLNSFGRSVCLVSRLGDDALGQEARTRLGALPFAARNRLGAPPFAPL